MSYEVIKVPYRYDWGAENEKRAYIPYYIVIERTPIEQSENVKDLYRRYEKIGQDVADALYHAVPKGIRDVICRELSARCLADKRKCPTDEYIDRTKCPQHKGKK